MQPFTVKSGIVVPIDRSNVDTDAILPKQFLRSIKRTGFGVSLFEEWRYLDTWHSDIDYKTRILNQDFILNFPKYKNASILVARENFGCGSSREHAVWALYDYGIHAIIAPSFGDIFFNNCFKNGVLPVELKESEIDEIFTLIQTNDSEVKDTALKMTVNLPKQTVNINDIVYNFTIDNFRKNCLLEGLDDIGMTLKNQEKIKNFEENHQQKYPWVFNEIALDV